MEAASAAFFMQVYFLTIGLALLFLGWNMPNHYPPYPSFHNELMAGVGLISLTAGLIFPVRHKARVLSRSVVRIGLTRPGLVISALAVLPTVQYVVHMFPFRADAVMALMYGLGSAVALSVGQMWALREGRRKALLCLFGVIVAGGLVSFGIGLAQWLRLSASSIWMTPLIGDRPFGNLAQSNHFGLLMAMGVIASVAVFEQRGFRHTGVLSALCACFGFGILISQSRAAALAFVLVGFVWGWTRRRVETRLHVVPVMCAFAIWIALMLQFDAIQRGIHHLLLLDDWALRDRLDGGVRPALWRHFWIAIMERPWIGYGFNQGVAAMAEVAPRMVASATRSTVFAHSFLLDLAVWGGLPLALATAGGMLWGMLCLLGGKGSVEERQQRHLVFSFCLVLVVQSLLEYPYAYAYFLLPLALLCGMVINAPEMTLIPDSKPEFGLTTFCAALVSLLVTCAVTLDYFRLEDDFRHARFSRANYLNRPAHEYLEKPLVLDAIATSIRASQRRAVPDMPEEQIEELRAVARSVQIPAAQIDYAKALALNGRLDQAWGELAILRGLYSPEAYTAIEAEWRKWLAEQPKRPEP